MTPEELPGGQSRTSVFGFQKATCWRRQAIFSHCCWVVQPGSSSSRHWHGSIRWWSILLLKIQNVQPKLERSSLTIQSENKASCNSSPFKHSILYQLKLRQCFVQPSWDIYWTLSGVLQSTTYPRSIAFCGPLYGQLCSLANFACYAWSRCSFTINILLAAEMSSLKLISFI